jgi:hypothetical protein
VLPYFRDLRGRPGGEETNYFIRDLPSWIIHKKRSIGISILDNHNVILNYS